MGLELDAVYFDGASSARHQARISVADGLAIAEDGATLAVWPFAEIRRADAGPGKLRLQCRSAHALARLEFADDGPGRALLGLIPASAAREVGATAKIVGWSLAAGASILGLVWFGMPYAADRLAPMTPPAFENRVGQMVDNQVSLIFGGKTCDGADGLQALKKLTARLQAQAGIAQSAQVKVLTTHVPNAFATPGDRIFVLRGLIDAARSPDELAGVLAHEIGHVKHHDGMRKLIEAGGSSFLVGLLFGDVTGSGAAIFATRALFDASYSRQAETRADGVAIDVMRSLGRSPEPLGVLLMRLTAEHRAAEKSTSMLNSHPLTEERLAAMRAANVADTGPALLTPAEWIALKTVCR